MKLTYEGIKERRNWEAAGIELPGYDPALLAERTKKAPEWVHFGIGNIFRMFLGGIADRLISEGRMDKGITCVEAFDYDVADRIYAPFDNLALSVTLHEDGRTDKRVLGYSLFADGMHDPEIKELARQIGYVEGLPVAEDPGILSPKEFLDEVMQVRFPNHYLGDTSARIAVDISQMAGIRFGETIKAYVSHDGDAKRLKAIPLAIAGWLRYLLAVDDEGEPFELSPDPMLPELREKLKDVQFGRPDTLADRLRPILSNENIFGVDLYEAGIGEKIEEMVRRQLGGPGAVRETLKYYLYS